MDPNILDDPEGEMDGEHAPEEKTEDQRIQESEERQLLLKKIQEEAHDKQKHRNDVLGEILRSKGFFWQATSNVSLLNGFF